MNVKRLARGPLFWVVVIILLLVLFRGLWSGGSDYKSVDTSQVVAAVDTGQITNAIVHDKEQTIQVTLKDGSKLQASFATDQEAALVSQLQKLVDQGKLPADGGYTVKVSHGNIFLEILLNALPILLLVGLMVFMLSQMQGGGSRVMNFGKSRAKLITKDTPKTTFADVAGADEAIEELMEIKEFLENPAKFQA
ncbi:MAG: ATP-dependent metallopeptidase FtsH/Yme1/Tma family protein, partial [Acidothermus cellulolyticus]|nr:ATP-dependent metallopeptidase FtsH/Yme1/Tma family protein [Acidothermus cellulolyticus]